MKLQTLKLHGFKSFADRTTLDFRDGVTAIVGSNGCGKSNIADAIRWVLGEQRASAIRGSRMDEVIFQGTARRRPLNFAEVSLLFDNQAGRIPLPQSELEVSRKVFREGGSEYAINRTACRLRDVQGLLRDTGLGANAYSIIEAGMIDALLGDRAEERRALFEEAAGIGKYKDSRQAASRRLDGAEGDLRRLDDLIAEVETKVRSLNRQKRKAERYQELRRRRLDLEIGIAQAELRALEDALERATTTRTELEATERSAAADRATAEAILEERRIEAADLGRQRTKVSARLDEVRTRLDEKEKAVLVARERRAGADARRNQLTLESESISRRIADLEQRITRLENERVASLERVAEARTAAEARSRENQQIREMLGAERANASVAAEASRKLARDIASAEGQRASSERQGREARERRETLTRDVERLSAELAQMSDQTELWATEADVVRGRIDTAVAAHDALSAELSVLRGREQRASEEARTAEDTLSALAAQVAAREAVERDYEGFAPAVAAIMKARERFPGVHGPLADALKHVDEENEDRARLIETYLGPLLQALVVEDLATARAVRRWFREEWSEGGSLVLLPVEAVAPRSTGEKSGPGAWVEALLSDLVMSDDDPLAALAPGQVRVGPGGEVVDARGMIRLLAAGDGQRILSRRGQLARLRKELEKSTRARIDRYRERDELREQIRSMEQRTIEAAEERRAAEAQLKGLESDAAAYRGRRTRLIDEHRDAERRLGELVAAIAETEARLASLEEHLAGLSRSVEDAARNETEVRERLVQLERQWDAAREQEADLRIRLARSESDLKDCDRNLGAARGERDAAKRRMQANEAERAELLATVDSLEQQNEQAGGEIEELFRIRDEESGVLAVIDARLAEVDSELAEVGERARGARRGETEAGERRHRLDLEIAETSSRIERLRERLEVEWGRPWSALVAEATPPSEGDTEAWRATLRTVTEQLEGVGPVNMLAVEEHAEEQRRLEFLLEQRKDLVTARDNLVTAIREINKTAREAFESTFEAVRTNFRRTFQSLFEGGDCEIWLADPSDPLESMVEIQASPFGKKTQRIHLLSGGERTLTALALLFALYLVKPSPFCVLDEIDAPLDETNVGRFIRLLRDFKEETQFIVITHHPRTMEAADWVYGVTMEEPGVSSVVGVELMGALAETSGVPVPTPIQENT